METAEYLRQWRTQHKEHLRKYFRAHYRAHREEKRAYNRTNYTKNAEQISQQKHAYYLANREKIAAKRKRVAKDKRSAQSAIQQAIVSGRLIRPEACEQCGRPAKVDAHHHKGYGAKLDVLWLCRKCHFRVHHP
jgi:hypothetical protein